MQKKYKVIGIIGIFIIIFIFFIYYLLTPMNVIDIEDKVEKINNKENLKDIYLKDLEIYEKGLEANIKLVIEENKLNSILNSNFLDEIHSNIENIYVNLNEKKLHVYIPYKVINLIYTQIEFEATPKVDKDKFYIIIENAKLGKINISDNIVSKIIKENLQNTGFEIEKNIISIEKNFIEPFSLKDVKVNKSNLYITANISINDLTKFVVNNQIKINESNTSLVGENLWNR